MQRPTEPTTPKKREDFEPHERFDRSTPPPGQPRPRHLPKRHARGALEHNSVEAHYDQNTGMQRVAKVARFPEIFRPRFDPEEFCKQPIPADVLAAFYDVFGDYARVEKRLKLAFHPWFRRWAIWEMEAPSKYGHNSWGLIRIIHDPESVRRGYLPEDLQTDDHRYDNLRGLIGNYRLPNRRDFEWTMENAEFGRSGGPDKIVRYLLGLELKRERDAECTQEAFEHDLFSYYFHAKVNEANRLYGSGQRMQSYDCTPKIREDERFWDVEDVRDAQGFLLYKRKRLRADPRTEEERAFTKDGVSEEKKIAAHARRLAADMAPPVNDRLLPKLAPEAIPAESTDHSIDITEDLRRARQAALERAALVRAK